MKKKPTVNSVRSYKNIYPDPPLKSPKHLPALATPSDNWVCLHLLENSCHLWC